MILQLTIKISKTICTKSKSQLPEQATLKLLMRGKVEGQNDALIVKITAVILFVYKMTAVIRKMPIIISNTLYSDILRCLVLVKDIKSTIMCYKEMFEILTSEKIEIFGFFFA